MDAGARLVAIEVLRQWEQSGLPLEQLIAEQLSQTPLSDPRERSLALALVHETVRWQGRLDWLLARFSTHPLAGMKPRTRQALRIGLVQLLYMERIPAPAAINETVKALKKARQPAWLLGFVNGVLRSISRALPNLPEPEVAGDPLATLALRTSHPLWLVQHWAERYGLEQTKQLCDRNNLRPPLCLRVNTLLTSRSALQERLRRAGLSVEAGRFAPEALLVQDHKGSITDIPGYSEGLFQVQDEAAQLIAPLLQPGPEGRYLDACAGLGGKTTHLAQLLAGQGRVVAVEPNARRLALLAENLSRLKLADRVEICAGEIEQQAARLAKGGFAGILVDAPCSGFGVIRRHPEIRWNRELTDLPRFQAMQLFLLKTVAPLIASGGMLIYSTCSLEPVENQEVVRLFLEDNPAIRLVDARTRLPEQAASLVDEEGFLSTMPDERDLDGFFAACLRAP